MQSEHLILHDGFLDDQGARVAVLAAYMACLFAWPAGVPQLCEADDASSSFILAARAPSLLFGRV